MKYSMFLLAISICEFNSQMAPPGGVIALKVAKIVPKAQKFLLFSQKYVNRLWFENILFEMMRTFSLISVRNALIVSHWSSRSV